MTRTRLDALMEIIGYVTVLVIGLWAVAWAVSK